MSARLAGSLLSRTSRSSSYRLSQAHLQLPFHAAPTRTMATAIPKTMKGVQIEKIGGVEVLDYRTDLPVPTPMEGEILVKNDFVGINYIDVYVYPILIAHRTLSTDLPSQLHPNWPLPLPQARDPGSRR